MITLKKSRRESILSAYNSSSSASIYISSGHEISLIVPLMLDENGKILKMYENPQSSFLDGFTLTMSNNTVVDLNSPFSYQANVYSGYIVQDFRLFYSRSGGQSRKIIFVRTIRASEITSRLGRGWLSINLYGDNVLADR